MTTTAEETTQSRAVVLAEIVRLVDEEGLPVPASVAFWDEWLDLKFDASDELDAWARHLDVTPRVSTTVGADGQPDSWQYRARQDQEPWLGRRVELLVIHEVPAADELVPQPAVQGGGAR